MFLYTYSCYVTGFPDTKGTLTRIKLWQQFGDVCKGHWVRGICSYGAADLPEVIKSPALFANKIHLELDSIAYRCLELWYRYRTLFNPPSNFDIDFYRNQIWVKNHV